MSTFQTIVLGIFGFFVIAGLMVIALTKTRGGEAKITVEVWGAQASQEFKALGEEFFPSSGNLTLSYNQIPEAELDQKLLEALAVSRGPDALLLPAELLLRWRDKLTLISYATYPEREYKDAFIQGADIFLFPDGIAALPFSVDPLVMYWNRDMFDSVGIANAPKVWDEFLLLASRLTVRDRLGNISIGATPLGEYRNVLHAREILAALFMQGGNQVVAKDTAGALSVTLAARGGAESVLNFYTEFANPAKPTYSWNRAMPDSQSAFLGGRSAVYFGLGSELSQLRRGNPNLNFDAAFFPRPRNTETPITYGKFTGIAVLRASRNPSAALQVAVTLTAKGAIQKWSSATGLPPIRRELLATKPTDAFGSILYDSAIRSRGFLDPNPAESNAVFQNMIESVTSGKAQSGQALQETDGRLSSLLR